MNDNTQERIARYTVVSFDKVQLRSANDKFYRIKEYETQNASWKEKKSNFTQKREKKKLILFLFSYNQHQSQNDDVFMENQISPLIV